MFHFTDKKGLIGILISKKIWLTNTKELNDYSERIYANLLFTSLLYDVDNDENVKYIRDNLSSEDILEANLDTMNYDAYSASFCEEYQNNVLWKKYADNNKGVAIEFNKDYLKEYLNDKIKDVNINVRPVFYGVNRKEFSKIIKLATNLCDIGHNDNIKAKNKLFMSLYIASGIFKDKKFCYEKETKLHFLNQYSDEYIQKFPTFALYKMKNEENLKFLGLLEEIKDDKKRRVELNLSEIFDSNLIPSIILGKEYIGQIECLRELLNSLGLEKTKIKDYVGNIL